MTSTAAAAWERAQRRRVRTIPAAVRPTAPLQVYRGCNPATVRGIFWTTSLFEASGYADWNRGRGYEPAIARAVVPGQAVVAQRVTLRWSIWIARGIPHPSGEVQVDPDALHDVAVDLLVGAALPDASALRRIGRLPAQERDAALSDLLTGWC